MLTTVHDLWFLLLTDRERTMTLATRIAELRRQKNESLQDVATAAGVTKTHFGVSIAYLVGEDIEAADADQNLARMFRLAGELDEHERRVIDDMIGVFRRRRLERDGHRT
jgi:transcriptional regulator with XRE-family HTH domain